MTVAVASGKGGTGKTTIAVNLALSTPGEVCLADCDVEEPNGQLFLDVKIDTREPVFLPVPLINQEACTGCRTCVDFCEFNALTLLGENLLVFEQLCHGCGGCKKFCPAQAISEKQKEIGQVFTGTSSDLGFLYGQLNIGEVLAPAVIKAVQERTPAADFTIIDSPPGTTCAMVQAVSTADYCIIAAENTPFGYHDAEMAVEAVKKMGIPLGAVINRADIGSSRLEDYLREQDIPVLMRIPFSRRIAELYSNGIPFVQEMPEYRHIFAELSEKVREAAGGARE